LSFPDSPLLLGTPSKLPFVYLMNQGQLTRKLNSSLNGGFVVVSGHFS
jgi:hypothetical protein